MAVSKQMTCAQVTKLSYLLKKHNGEETITIYVFPKIRNWIFKQKMNSIFLQENVNQSILSIQSVILIKLSIHQEISICIDTDFQNIFIPKKNSIYP